MIRQCAPVTAHVPAGPRGSGGRGNVRNRFPAPVAERGRRIAPNDPRDTRTPDPDEASARPGPPKDDERRAGPTGGAAAVALSGAAITASAPAGEPPGDGGDRSARAPAGPGAFSCPDIASRPPGVPGSARAEADRAPARLGTRIQEAGRRLAGTTGRGGPDFVRNAAPCPLRTNASPPSTAPPPPSAAPPNAPRDRTPRPPARSPRDVTGAAAHPARAPAGAAADSFPAPRGPLRPIPRTSRATP